MTIIADLLDRDPRNNRLVNNGQARLDADQAEARGEIETFVCEGRYSDGIARILESFARDLDKTSQQAGWLSGFYGSGKSHLLKMLAYFWENRPFADHLTPRQVVRGGLSENVKAALVELDIQGNRAGGLFAVSGNMPSGTFERPRYTVLSFVLKAARLPADYGLANFCLFIEKRGIRPAVEAEIAAAGGNFDAEVQDLFVSPIIATALMKADPTLGGSTRDVRDLLKKQFKSPDTDIDKDAFTRTLRDVLLRQGKGGKLPLTLIVLDEVQIYIGNSQDRAGMISEITETLAKEFDSKVILVAAGQSGLAGTPTLARLLDRFTIRVQLDDNDVETVTRRVLLRKKAGARPEIDHFLDTHAAAVSRRARRDPDCRAAGRPQNQGR